MGRTLAGRDEIVEGHGLPTQAIVLGIQATPR
jgi:hypothetical protein